MKAVDLRQIHGGQIWEQDSFPHMVRYVIATPYSEKPFVLLSDPRLRGSVACTETDGTWKYTASELAEKFKRLRYSYKGQLCELLT